MAWYLTSSPAASGKFITVAIPASTQNTGLPLQIEWEIEFEAARFQTDFPVSSTAGNSAGTLVFLRTGSDFELRSPSNSNWIVTTGLTLSDFNWFRLRSTFDGATHLQQLFLNGSTTPFATRNPTTAAIGAQAALFSLGNSTRAGGIKYYKFTDFVTPTNSRYYDASASGGSGNILLETLNGFDGTQSGTWPTDNSEWIFYSSGEIAFTGDIGKAQHPLTSKALDVNAGVSISTGKQSLSLLPKPLTVSAGWTTTAKKQTLNVVGKQEGVSIGHLLSINEQHLTMQSKPLTLVTGTEISFLGVLNKTALNLSPKQFSVLAGTSIPVSAAINKLSLTLSPKQLGVSVGTSLPFNGSLSKTSYNLSGKVLSNVRGSVLELQKQALQIVSKQLSVGETIYPVVPVERLFTFTDKNNRTYVFKQTTNIYIMRN